MKFYWFVPWLLALLSVGIVLDTWYSAHAAGIQQQQERQQFLTQLAAAIAAKPGFTDELLTASADLCQCVQLRWQRLDGGAEFVAGSVSIPQAVLPQGWSTQQNLPAFAISIDHESQLVAVFAKAHWFSHWLQLLLAVVAMLAAGLAMWCCRNQAGQRQQLAAQLQRLVDNDGWQAQDFSGQMQLLHMVEVEFLQRRQKEQELRAQVAGLTQQLQSQQTNAVQQSEQQLRLLQQLQHENHGWQLLCGQFRQFTPAQIAPLMAAFAALYEQPSVQKDWLEQSFTSWYQQQFELAAALLLPGNQLLPDEDPAICRTQVEVDYQQLTSLIHLLFELIRPQNSGPETVFGYRLMEDLRPCLLITVQHNGYTLPARVKQVLKQGPLQSPEWPELLAELMYRLLQNLSGSIDWQELTDVGCRFTLKIPVRFIAKPEKKLCQNMLVYDSRECRQSLWRHSLQGVAEQLLMVSTLTQLWHTAKHRLIDRVVVHLSDEAIGTQELEQLNILAQRYPMTLFTGKQHADVCRALAEVARVQQTPVLLAAMCDHRMVTTMLSDRQLLVVDDNQTNLSFIRAMLTGMGLEIDYATSGSEAIRLAQHSKYQLILMDIQLPDIAGTEVTKQIRQLRHHQHTQVLAFTAHALPEEAASFKLAGMDDVLFKPLDERKIAHILQRLRTVRATT